MSQAEGNRRGKGKTVKINAPEKEERSESVGLEIFNSRKYSTSFFSNNSFTDAQSSHSFEPLPYFDKLLFEEPYDSTHLNLNINPFAEVKRVFLPHVPIIVTVEASLKGRYHIFNPYLYKIKLQHGGFEWEVRRTYKELKMMHKTLAKFTRSQFTKASSPRDFTIEGDCPMFPYQREYMTSDTSIDEFNKHLKSYLELVLSYPPFRNHPCVYDILCVSPVSFLNETGSNILEGLAEKKVIDYLHMGRCSYLKNCYEDIRFLNKYKWFCIKGSCIVYLNPDNNNSVGFVMFVDRGFKFKKCFANYSSNCILVKNLQRTLLMKFKTSQQQNEWFEKIEYMLKTTGRYFHDESYLPNGSFAPVRPNQMCRWYVNAAQYMEHVMYALNSAKEEIFITDWFLSPELFLKRPTDDLQYRLDKILLKKAKEGVRIYILLFKEIGMVVNLMSSRTKHLLTEHNKNPNIKILRHPKNNGAIISFWSHHEKSVVIDQSLAFIGGIDLCFGRWDDDSYRLIDLGVETNVTDLIMNLNKKPIDFSEADFCFGKAIHTILSNSIATSSSICTMNSVDDTKKAPESKVKKQLKKFQSLKFDTEANRLKTFIQAKSFHGFANKAMESDSDSEMELETENNNKQQEETQYLGMLRKDYYWIGKDYCNTFVEDFKDLDDYQQDQFDRTIVPRMPWRDQGLVMFGHSARDLARHFIQRWNECKYELEPDNQRYPVLIPKSSEETIKSHIPEWLKHDSFKCTIQITRSLDEWSGGISMTESSILKAYCKLISDAEHYIYIENQFFITTCDPLTDNHVKNTIGLCLVERIIKAHKANKKFRVYVVLPLLPGFSQVHAIEAVQYFNLRSIVNSEHSIYTHLSRAGISDPSDYITFHGMRNWAVLMGNLVQEIIYVHSKLMIVDDKHVICGSANINDRSLLGKRDSELASVISDEEFVTSQLNGQKCQVGKYAFSLRQKIFKLHLGIYFNNPKHIDVTDCVSDEFYNLFRDISARNTDAYDDVFKCIPSDNIATFDELKAYVNSSCLVKTHPELGKKRLETDIMGLIVDYPLDFLCREKNLYPALDTTAGILPKFMWT